MKREATSLPTVPATERRAFILPIVLVLITVMATLGTYYLFSTIQSKNVFHVFYRDDLARLIAESAVSEYRATLFDRIQANPLFQALIQNPPSNVQGVDFSLTDLPVTTEMVKNLIGADQVELSGKIQVRGADFNLIEVVDGVEKRSTFDREYQGTMRFQFYLGLGPSGKRRFSSFIYEYDVKRACMRSPSTQRVGRFYTTNALNDYVLYIRDAYDEFRDLNVKGTSLNNDDRILFIDHANSGQRGKIFLGCARETDPDRQNKFVFVNVNNDMDWLLPDPPVDIKVPWDTLKTLMPKFTQKLTTEIDAAKNQPGVSINFYPEKVNAIISVEYKPLVGKVGWWQNIVARVKALFDRFFNARQGTTDANKQLPVHLVGTLDNDQSMCDLIEGNVRQRFWQTATFRMDFSQITDPGPAQDAFDQGVGDKFNIDVLYFSGLQLSSLFQGGATDETKETYKVIKHYQDLNNSLLMSMPNDQFPFIPKPKFDTDRNSLGKLPNPPLVGRSMDGSKTDYTNFLPFAPFLVRSYRFTSSQELYDSHFYDAEKNLLHLNGIIMIENKAEGLTLLKNMQYTGRGVLLSYGDIKIKGSFTKANDAPEGSHCVLYTYRGNIIANQEEAGLIQASLVALNYKFSATGPSHKYSTVNFSGRKAQVFGSLQADRLQLGTMAPKPEENKLTYDSGALTGPMLYTTTVGGRLRSARMVLDDTGARN